MTSSVLNFNVGVLGHIDSGKTSLAKALSTTASTASFDKNPQSKERGITLDLGFSSFCVPVPDHLADDKLEQLQFTLVDCPGHASLIRTIIGGAQIIDLMMLVIDITKGMQTQTAECLVIGEITCEKMIIVLNKVDLLPESKRSATIDKMVKRMQKTLEGTKFANAPIIPVAARPGASESDDQASIGVETLIESLTASTYIPQRFAAGPFIFAVDHCFSIRGQGTIMTGTVLSGTVANNEIIEIPTLKESRKVKSMQMFRKPVDKAKQGDRVGICVTQFDPKLLERGLVCAPGALPTVDVAVIKVQRIKYFKGTVATKSKFHVTMGHDTVMARVTFFGSSADSTSSAINTEKPSFNFNQDYKYQEELLSLNPVKSSNSPTGASGDDVDSEDLPEVPAEQFALLQFEKPVTCSEHCLVIGAKLDIDIHTTTCRLAFFGKMLHSVADPHYANSFLPKLKIFKMKKREGVVERKVDDYSVICRGLFKKESNMSTFVGLKVQLSTGEKGVIEGSFGQSGKFKVRVPDGLSAAALQALVTKPKKSKGKASEEPGEEEAAKVEVQIIQIILEFKRFMYDPKKQMIQT